MPFVLMSNLIKAQINIFKRTSAFLDRHSCVWLRRVACKLSLVGTEAKKAAIHSAAVEPIERSAANEAR
jgi:hypothetical protein